MEDAGNHAVEALVEECAIFIPDTDAGVDRVTHITEDGKDVYSLDVELDDGFQTIAELDMADTTFAAACTDQAAPFMGIELGIEDALTMKQEIESVWNVREQAELEEAGGA
jgi:hypothetical protein